MDDFMAQAQTGLRRRRRAIPEDVNEPFPRVLRENNFAFPTPHAPGEGGGGGEHAAQQPAEQVQRHAPPAAPTGILRNRQQSWPRRPPLSDIDSNNFRNLNNYSTVASWRVAQVYSLVSTILAILAVALAPVNTLPTISEVPSNGASTFTSSSSFSSYSTTSTSWTNSMEQVAKAAAVGLAAKRGDGAPDTMDIMKSIHQWWNAQQLQQMNAPLKAGFPENPKQDDEEEPESSHIPSPFWWWKHNRQHKDGRGTQAKGTSGKESLLLSLAKYGVWATLSDCFVRWVDPLLWDPSSPTLTTDLIDKILTSTPRLLAIANFLIAMTYLVHSAVASWFLGDHAAGSATNSSGARGVGAPLQPSTAAPMVDWSSPTRERMGGFLVFKLLLISAVVAPDTLDLLILLTWYTTLSCLRSLDHLAHARSIHASALGQAPPPGVIQLLLVVLVGNSLAAASCVALFHAAGWGMVVLLTCDCALLAADVVSHILKHFTCVLEDIHGQIIQRLEARQMRLHNAIHAGSSNEDFTDEEDYVIGETYDAPLRPPAPVFGEDGGRFADVIGEHEESSPLPTTREELLQESRRLDERMEVLDLAHARRLSIMDSFIFALELICHSLTVGHFCHIWSLHGVQFTLIDGVLALHLHSAISTACKKIAQRRNIHSIARDLHGLFPNASDQELRKASLAGDVCCICLGTMSTGGHVKKVPCGHLYHTHCLREVVERAQSVQAAKCPLCRSCLLDGSREGDNNSRRPTGQTTTTTTTTAAAGANNATQIRPTGGDDANALIAREQQPPPQQQQQQQQALPPQPANGNEHALFRFSTEGILPAWLPIPAFAFEVVRRPPGPTPLPPVFRQRLAQQLEEQQQLPAEGVRPPQNGPVAAAQAQLPTQREHQQELSFLRRFLIMAGAIPMSPEEEARALAHLVDMFPQYERNALLRELRERGSAEAVAEAILMGVFASGVPRGA